MIRKAHHRDGVLNEGRILMAISDSKMEKHLSFLFSQEGIETDSVHLAASVMERVHSNVYDIIIVEDYLPDNSGYILSAEILKELPAIIFMLGKSLSDVDEIGAYRIGISHYFTPDTPLLPFVVKCKSIIRGFRANQNVGSNGSDDGLISISGLTLNTKNGEVHKSNGQKVVLMKREADILRLLMENAGKELTRKEIYETIWKMPYIEGENSVANQMSRLRKKLGEDETSPGFIETRWGFGYSFKYIGVSNAC